MEAAPAGDTRGREPALIEVEEDEKALAAMQTGLAAFSSRKAALQLNKIQITA
jgi:hypothetical protein